jgi:hypothetical protein
VTQASATHRGIANVSPVTLFLPAAAVTTLLWVTSPNPVDFEAGLYAFLLLLIPWGSFLCWRLSGRRQLPLFAMIAGAYWLYFGVPLFWGSRGFIGAAAFATITPTESNVTAAIGIALIGVICLWTGMRIPVARLDPAKLPEIIDRPRSWAYVRLVLVVGVALGLWPEAVYVLGAEGRQLMTTLTTVVPGAAFVLLFDRYLSGTASRADKTTLIVCSVVRLVGGLASGWLGPIVAWGVTCASLVLLKRRSFPWKSFLATAFLLVFLQVGKNEFRSAYWYGETEGGLSQRAQFWLNRSASAWGDALQSDGNGNALNLALQTLQRTSLLMQVAHVLELTPSQVPFQEGATYRFVAVTLIPRFFWPDKPTVNDANRFYQVAYGLTAERDLGGVSIAVGSLAEGFINFGWPGAIGVMLLSGVILGVVQRVFLTADSSMLFLAVGLTLMPGFLAIEAQFGQYFGGFVQQTLLALASFLAFAARPASDQPPQAIFSTVHARAR